uniref:Apple domain-containing protein n=2 Tax=Octopus bimaculoides TaxID=37653 RepID=A0A0L8HWE5_OCTBM
MLLALRRLRRRGFQLIRSTEQLAREINVQVAEHSTDTCTLNVVLEVTLGSGVLSLSVCLSLARSIYDIQFNLHFKVNLSNSLGPTTIMLQYLVFYFAVNPVVNDLGTEDVGFPNRKKFMKLFNTGPEKNVTGIKMNLTLENCADACLKMETCKSFMAHDNTTECILYETWSGEIRYQSLKEENYYYYQKILDEKCPINVFYGGMFRDNEVMSKYKMTTYVECLKNCGKSTKCYSTNYDVSTAACYLIARNSTGIAIRRHYTNWIGTEVDRDKFDNDPNVLRDLNEKGCDLKFLYVLNVIDERTYPSDDTMRRGVLFSKRQNTSGNIKMTPAIDVDGIFDCAIRCMTSSECLGFKYESQCQMAVKY